MSNKPNILLPHETAVQLIASLESVLGTVRLAHADLACGNAGRARLRLETLLALNPAQYATDVLLANQPNVPPFKPIADVIPEWLR